VARLVAHLLEKERHQRPASARWVCEQISRLQRENGGSSALPEALNAFIQRSVAAAPPQGRHADATQGIARAEV
jgi:hypothetical protein